MDYSVFFPPVTNAGVRSMAVLVLLCNIGQIVGPGCSVFVMKLINK